MSSGFGEAFAAGGSDWSTFALFTNSTLKGYFTGCGAPLLGTETLIEVAVVLFALRFGISRIGRPVGGTLSAATFISGLILEVLALSPVYWRASSFGLDEALIATLAFSFITLPS
jgi:hypothetical protein